MFKPPPLVQLDPSYSSVALDIAVPVQPPAIQVADEGPLPSMCLLPVFIVPAEVHDEPLNFSEAVVGGLFPEADKAAVAVPLPP